MSAHRLRRNDQVLSTPRLPRVTVVSGDDTQTSQIRLVNESLTDPAGRYRLLISGADDALVLERALTALYATTRNILSYNVDTNLFNIDAVHAAAMRLILSAGSGAESTSIELGTTSGANRSIVFKTQNGTTRLTLDNPGANGRAVFGAGVDVVLPSVLAGSGGANVRLQGNYTTTDGTAYRVTLEALNTTGDAQVVSAQAVPNGANPFFTIFAPDVAPTTTQLDVNNVTWRYTPAGALVAYVNNAAAIKSLSLGTPA